MLVQKIFVMPKNRLKYVLEELRTILWNFWSYRIWEMDFIQKSQNEFIQNLELVLIGISNSIWNLEFHLETKL